MVAWALPAASQTTFSVEHSAILLEKEGPTPELIGHISHTFGASRHGAFLFAWGERTHKHNHGNAIAGLWYEAVRGVRVGFGAGADESFSLNRAGTMMSVERWGVKALGVYDGGKGFPWYTFTVNSPTWKHTGARFQGETHLGLGPGVNFAVKHLTFWASLPYSRHQTAFNPVFGVAFEHHLPFGRKERH